MAITVVCPGCKKRFAVDDKFAGKKGPCPKCKAVILVPEKTEEVVVHGEEQFGPKGASGRAVLKPIERTETKFSVKLAIFVVVAVLVALLTAWLFRTPKGTAPWWLLTLGAVVLAPPLALGGYAFLRDDELEPYRGRELLIRAPICGLVYAVIWGVVAIFTNYVFGGTADLFTQVLLVLAMVGVGGFAAYASLDLDFGMGAMHYALYLTATMILRLILNLSVLGIRLPR